MKIFRLLGFSCFLMVFSYAASATLIDFEGVVTDADLIIPASPYVEDNFLINNPTIGTDGIFGSTSGANSNGSSVFGWCGGCDSILLTLSHTDGQKFSLLSMDTAFLNTGQQDSQSINITGFFSGGGSILTSIELGSNWATTLLVGFTNLTHLEFTAENPGPDLAFDNLVVTTTVVPEPGSIALLMFGIAGLVFARNKHSK